MPFLFFSKPTIYFAKAIYLLLRIVISVIKRQEFESKIEKFSGKKESKNNILIMNVKRIFGTILTVLGIVGLIYTGYELIMRSNAYTNLAVVGVLALIFFSSGISLVKNTKDES